MEQRDRADDSRRALQRLCCPSPSHPRLLSRLHTSVESSLLGFYFILFFSPVLEEAAVTVMLKDEPGHPTPPSLSSTHKLT